MRRVPPRHRDRSELITGLPAMLSIAWFPLATLLFQVTESAILVRDAVRIRFLRGRGDMNLTLVTRPLHVHDGKTPTNLGEAHAKQVGYGGELGVLRGRSGRVAGVIPTVPPSSRLCPHRHVSEEPASECRHLGGVSPHPSGSGSSPEAG